MSNISLEEYNKALEFIIKKIKNFPKEIQPKCIIHNGHINSPGISDIDLLIGFDDNFVFSLDFLNRLKYEIDKLDNARTFFYYLPYLYPFSALKELPFFTFNNKEDLKIIFGDINFKNTNFNKYQNILNSMENAQSRIIALIENLLNDEKNNTQLLLIGHSLIHSINSINNIGANISKDSFLGFNKVEKIRKIIIKNDYAFSEDEYKDLCNQLIEEYFYILNWIYKDLDKKIFVHFSKTIDKYFYKENILLENMVDNNRSKLHFHKEKNLIFISGFRWYTKCIFENYFENVSNYKTLFYDSELKKQINSRVRFFKKLNLFNFKNFNNAYGRSGISPLIKGMAYNKLALSIKN